MDTPDEFDVVVIGGGPPGENAADYAIRDSDRTAAVVESGLLGGECSYFACMPSKALLRPLDVAAAAAHLGGLGPVPLDRDALLARRDEWVSHYSDAGQVRWLEGAGLTLVRGRGRLTGVRQVTVTDTDGAERVLTARLAVVLANGSTAVVSRPLAGLEPWISSDATGVVEVPGRLVVIGGGVVACEAARWLSALGSRVTMLVRGDRVLDRLERFASDLVVEGLRRDGIEVRFGVQVSDAERDDPRATGLGRVHGGPWRLTLETGESLDADEVLVATGRRANVAEVGLESVGVRPEDLRARTGGAPLPPWLFAVGDVSQVAPLTHWGKYQARMVGATIAARADGKPDPEAPEDVPVPQVVFTDPQVASVGLTSDEAANSGRRVRLADSDYTAAAGAGLLRDDASGHARLVIDADSDQLLGATFVGPDVAEIVHAATVAITGGVTTATLRHAVASYPTASEIWLRLLP